MKNVNIKKNIKEPGRKTKKSRDREGKRQTDNKRKWKSLEEIEFEREKKVDNYRLRKNSLWNFIVPKVTYAYYAKCGNPNCNLCPVPLCSMLLCSLSLR